MLFEINILSEKYTYPVSTTLIEKFALFQQNMKKKAHQKQREAKPRNPKQNMASLENHFL